MAKEKTVTAQIITIVLLRQQVIFFNHSISDVTITAVDGVHSSINILLHLRFQSPKI